MFKLAEGIKSQGPLSSASDVCVALYCWSQCKSLFVWYLKNNSDAKKIIVAMIMKGSFLSTRGLSGLIICNNSS